MFLIFYLGTCLTVPLSNRKLYSVPVQGIEPGIFWFVHFIPPALPLNNSGSTHKQGDQKFEKIAQFT